MVVRRQPILALALMAVLAVAGFASPGAAESGALEPLTIETGTGVHTIEVEVARTPEERGVGLMHRTELAPDRGMLFDFGTVRQVTMWMKNTLIPLDMFFAESSGRIVTIAERTTPLSEKTHTLRPAGSLRAGDGGWQRRAPRDRARRPPAPRAHRATVSEARLKTEVLVQAGFRYCQQALLSAALRRRGDADAGALLVKVSRLDGTAAVFARTLSLDGGLTWRRATGEGWIPEEEAEARLTREIDFDPDVWIVEVEDPEGRNPFATLTG